MPPSVRREPLHLDAEKAVTSNLTDFSASRCTGLDILMIMRQKTLTSVYV